MINPTTAQLLARRNYLQCEALRLQYKLGTCESFEVKLYENALIRNKSFLSTVNALITLARDIELLGHC